MYWNAYDIEMGVMVSLGRTNGYSDFHKALMGALVNFMGEVN